MINLPAPSDYWTRPPKSPKGEPDAKLIFHAVGEALTEWEIVELSFAHLFTVLIESPSYAAIRAYGSIISPGGRRDALRAASDVFFRGHNMPADEMADFDTLMNHVSLAVSRRNDIAHAMACLYDDGNELLGVFLVPPDYSTKKTDPFGNEFSSGFIAVDYRYVSRDINSFCLKFRALKDATYQYTLRLDQTYGHHP
jgi:hypothetical protein